MLKLTLLQAGPKQKMEQFLPETAILSSSAPWDDLGDEDAGIVANVRVVPASSDAEPQA